MPAGLLNPSFEDPITPDVSLPVGGWGYQPGGSFSSPAFVIVERSTDWASSGTHSLHVKTAINDDETDFAAINPGTYTDDTTLGSGAFAVEPGTEYTLSADFNVIHLNDATGGVFLELLWFNADFTSSHLDTSDNAAFGITTGLSITATAGAGRVWLVPIIAAYSGGGDYTEFYVDNFDWSGSYDPIPVPPTPTSTVLITREYPADELALTVEGRSGVLKRWGPDELDGADVPMALQFTTANPNGDNDLTSSLLRPIDLDYPDNQLLGDVKVYGPAQEEVWGGRMTQFPRQHGDDFNISPAAVGYSAHLLDDPQFSEAYVNADPSTWTDPPFNRKQTLAAANISFGDFSWSTGGANGGGGLICALPSGSTLGAQTVAEAWYIAPAGVLIAKVIYRGKDTSLPSGWQAPRVSTDDNDAGSSMSANSITLDDTLRTVTLTEADRYLMVNEYSNGTASTPADGANRSFSVLAAYGSHGLTTRPIDAETADGIYLSDIVRDVVSRAAPLLDTTNIQQNSIVIPHAVFTQSTASDALLFLNNYAQWDWGCRGRKFYFQEPDPTRLTWTVRLDEGTGLALEGEEADDQYNGLIVTFTDTLGAQRSYGPPGSNCDYTDASLVDTDPENPVNAAGIPRKWAKLDVPDITTPQGALTIGVAKFDEVRLPQRRGTITVKGFAHHPTQGLRPAWQIRAGDFVVVEDHPANVARKIISTRYDRQSRTNELTVGNTSHKVDALLVAIGSALIGKV